MKIQPVLGLCLSGCLIIAGPLALADNDKEKSNNRSARAVQVHIDKDTGQKIAEDDSVAATSSVAATTVESTEMNKWMPPENQAPVAHADGMRSAQLGQESLKFMTMTIGEDGEKAIKHETLDEYESKTEATPAEKGLE